MKTINLKLTCMFLIFIIPSIIHAQALIEPISITYEQLNSEQKAIYNRVNRYAESEQELPFLRINELNIPDDDGKRDVDLRFLGLKRLVFQSDYVMYNSERDYEYNGIVDDSPGDCLNEECDTIAGDSLTAECINGHLTITANRSEKSGHLTIGGSNYNIVDLTGNVWTIYKVREIGTCGNTEKEMGESDGGDPGENKPDGADCKIHTLRILVLYTPKALTAAQQMGTSPTAIAQQSIAQLKSAWVRSIIGGSNTTFLVGVEPIGSHSINYTEPGGAALMSSELNSWVSNNSSNLDALRQNASFRADLVILFTDGNYVNANGGAVDGIAYVNHFSAQPFLAFGMVQIRHSTSNYTFAHEVGHLVGGLHDIPNDNINPSGSAHGFHFTLPYCCSHLLWFCIGTCDRYYKTIMAYDDGHGDWNIPNFSNPNVWLINQGWLHMGRTGLPGTNDNASKMNQMIPLVQDFLTETTPLSINFHVEPAVQCEPMVTAQVTSNCSTAGLTYKWYISYNGTSYTLMGATGSYFSHHVGINHHNAYTRYVKCVVTDNTGNSQTFYGQWVVPHCNGPLRLSAEKKKENIAATIFPNPGTSNFTLSFYSEEEGNFSFEIYNSIGELILMENKSLESGENSFNFNLSQYSAGAYICKIISPGKTQSLSFFKN